MYLFGDISKNAAGSNHDNFLTKYNSFGALQYSKLFLATPEEMILLHNS